MALAFSLVLLVQYIELPYGYVISSLLSTGKAGAASAGSFSTNETRNQANRTVSGGLNAASASQNVTNLVNEKKPETSKHSIDAFGGNDRVVCELIYRLS